MVRKPGDALLPSLSASIIYFYEASSKPGGTGIELEFTVTVVSRVWARRSRV
jgi:hypothetical protein